MGQILKIPAWKKHIKTLHARPNSFDLGKKHGAPNAALGPWQVLTASPRGVPGPGETGLYRDCKVCIVSIVYRVYLGVK